MPGGTQSKIIIIDADACNKLLVNILIIDGTGIDTAATDELSTWTENEIDVPDDPIQQNEILLKVPEDILEVIICKLMSQSMMILIMIMMYSISMYLVF